MFELQLVNEMCGEIALQRQLLTIRDKNIQAFLQIFVKLMNYFYKIWKSHNKSLQI